MATAPTPIPTKDILALPSAAAITPAMFAGVQAPGGPVQKVLLDTALTQGVAQLVGGGAGFKTQTLAQLNAAVGPFAEYAGASVHADGANNGIYSRVAGAWVRIGDLPDEYASDAADRAELAADAIDAFKTDLPKAINLWPDSLFIRSGGNLDFAYNGRKLYSRRAGAFAATWKNDADLGTGSGYWEAPAGGGLHAFNTAVASPAADLAGIAIGQPIVGTFLVMAAAGTGIRISGRFNTVTGASNGGITRSDFIATGGFQIIKSPENVIPANSVEAEFWCYNVGGNAGPIKIFSHATAAPAMVDAVAASDISNRNLAYAAKDINEAAAAVAKLVSTVSKVNYDTIAVNNAVAVPSIINRAADFVISGWGVTGPKPAVFPTANAVRIRRVNQTANASAKIAKLNFIFRTHATNPETATDEASLLVTAQAKVPPGQKDYFDVIMMLRDPLAQQNYKSLNLADMAARFGYMVYAYDANDVQISMNEIRGTTAGLPDTDKFLVTAQNAETAAWAATNGDGTGLGVEFLTLATTTGGPSQDDAYPLPSDTFLAEIQKAIGLNVTKPDAINLSAMPGYRAKKVKAQSGVGAWIGDSLTEVNVYGFRQFRALLDAKIGLSGPGYVSANGEIDVPPLNADGSVTATRARAGVWTDVRFAGDEGFAPGGYGPDGAHATTTQVGATISFTSPLGVTRHILHYIQQPNGGTFTYAIGGGAATAVDTNGALEYKTILLAGAAALNIAVTVAGAAGVTICGDDVRNDVAGKSVLHKIGNGGATASRFTDIPAAFFQTAIAALELDYAEICLSANDCYADVAPGAFNGHIETMLARIAAVRPLCSVALIAPGPNDHDGPFAIADYAAELHNISATRRGAFGNLEPSFGTYADALARGVMNNDGVHPSLDGAGGQIIAERRFDWLYA